MKNRKNKKNINNINVQNTISFARLKTFFVVILLLIVIMLGRVGFLQFVDGAELKTLATSQQTLTETISAKRGTIYDVNGQTLAMSYETDKIYVNPSSIKDEDKETIARGLADNLGLDYQAVLFILRVSFELNFVSFTDGKIIGNKNPESKKLTASKYFNSIAAQIKFTNQLRTMPSNQLINYVKQYLKWSLLVINY